MPQAYVLPADQSTRSSRDPTDSCPSYEGSATSTTRRRRACTTALHPPTIEAEPRTFLGDEPDASTGRRGFGVSVLGPLPSFQRVLVPVVV